MLVRPAPNLFTVESFLKVATGEFLNPTPADGIIFPGIVTPLLSQCLFQGSCSGLIVLTCVIEVTQLENLFFDDKFIV